MRAGLATVAATKAEAAQTITEFFTHFFESNGGDRRGKFIEQGTTKGEEGGK